MKVSLVRWRERRRAAGPPAILQSGRARELILSVALVLLSGCAASMTYAAAVTYLYETELPPDVSGGKPDYKTRIVSGRRRQYPRSSSANGSFLPVGP